MLDIYGTTRLQDEYEWLSSYAASLFRSRAISPQSFWQIVTRFNSLSLGRLTLMESLVNGVAISGSYASFNPPLTFMLVPIIETAIRAWPALRSLRQHCPACDISTLISGRFILSTFSWCLCCSASWRLHLPSVLIAFVRCRVDLVFTRTKKVLKIHGLSPALRSMTNDWGWPLIFNEHLYIPRRRSDCAMESCISCFGEGERLLYPRASSAWRPLTFKPDNWVDFLFYDNHVVELQTTELITSTLPLLDCHLDHQRSSLLLDIYKLFFFPSCCQICFRSFSRS